MNQPDPQSSEENRLENAPAQKQVHVCDRCGTEMRERNCKIICPNCGNRFDCSDLNIYFD